MLPLPDSLVEGFASCLDTSSLESLSNLSLNSEAQAGLDELAERANEGSITDVERNEYRAFIEYSEFLAHAQLIARSRLGLTLAS